jgi:outer membrane protein assembly factor BamB
LGTLGSNLIVGAPFDAPGGLLVAGTVYVIDKLTGAVLMRIPHPEPLLYGNSDDRFGRSVAGYEGNIPVGAPADDQSGFFTGGAYLLDGTTGAVMLRIPNPYPEPDYFSAFGYPVRSFCGKIVIGEPWHRSGGKDVGAVYVFDGKTGALLYTLQHPKPMDQLDVSGNRASFGYDLHEHDGFLAVSTPQDDVNGVRDAGSVYIFDLTNGQLVMSIHNPDPVAYDYFGSLAFHGGQIICKAHGKDLPDAPNAGEVYVFEGPQR